MRTVEVVAQLLLLLVTVCSCVGAQGQQQEDELVLIQKNAKFIRQPTSSQYAAMVSQHAKHAQIAESNLRSKESNQGIKRSDGQTTVNPDPLFLPFTTMVTNNLAGLGPIHSDPGTMIFSDVAVASGLAIDLVIQNVSEYSPKVTDGNGVLGAFGMININSGTATAFTGNLIEKETGKPHIFERFTVAFMDMDEGKTGVSAEHVMTCSLRQYTVTSNTSVNVVESDDGCFDFQATHRGTGADNPTDPSNLTQEQIDKSLSVTFYNVSSFDFTLLVQPGNGGRAFMFATMSSLDTLPATDVDANSGGNLTDPFALAAPELISDNGCPRYDMTGWFEGTYTKILGPSESPNGSGWSWQECAQQCAIASAEECEFWVLQESNLKQCLICKDEGEYHASGGEEHDDHRSGPRDVGCFLEEEEITMKVTVGVITDNGCPRYNTTGWFEGTYSVSLDASESPDGAAWTWQECAQECASRSTDECEFWLVQGSGAKCLLMTDRGQYHQGKAGEGDGVGIDDHASGPREPACLKPSTNSTASPAVAEEPAEAAPEAAEEAAEEAPAEAAPEAAEEAAEEAAPEAEEEAAPDAIAAAAAVEEAAPAADEAAPEAAAEAAPAATTTAPAQQVEPAPPADVA